MKRNAKCSWSFTSGGTSQRSEEDRIPGSFCVVRNFLAFLFCAIYMLVGSITTARAQAPGTGAIAGVVLTPPERWFPTTIFAFRALGAKGSEVQVLIATYQLHEAAAG